MTSVWPIHNLWQPYLIGQTEASRQVFRVQNGEIQRAWTPKD